MLEVQDIEFTINYITEEGKEYKIAKVYHTTKKTKDRKVNGHIIKGNVQVNIGCERISYRDRTQKDDIQCPNIKTWEDIYKYLRKFVSDEVPDSNLIETIQKQGKEGDGARYWIAFKKTPMSAEKRIYYLIKYLREKTNAEHRVKQSDIRKYFEDTFPLEDAKLSENTLRSLIKRIAEITNTDEEGHPKTESEWRIVYDEYTMLYGGDSDLEESVDDITSVSNIYYNHIFSDDEMNKLIQAINNSTEFFDDDEKRRLIIKIKENFT